MHGAAAPVTLPVSTVASKQLPDVTVVRMHNVPGGINVHGLMDCLLKHFQFGPEYTVVSEYGGFFFFVGYKGIAHPPSDDEGTERTWFGPKQRTRKRVRKRSVHGKQSPRGAEYGVMPQVTLLPPFQPGAAQTCA